MLSSNWSFRFSDWNFGSKCSNLLQQQRYCDVHRGLVHLQRHDLSQRTLQELFMHDGIHLPKESCNVQAPSKILQHHEYWTGKILRSLFDSSSTCFCHSFTSFNLFLIAFILLFILYCIHLFIFVLLLHPSLYSFIFHHVPLFIHFLSNSIFVHLFFITFIFLLIFIMFVLLFIYFSSHSYFIHLFFFTFIP